MQCPLLTRKSTDIDWWCTTSLNEIHPYRVDHEEVAGGAVQVALSECPAILTYPGMSWRGVVLTEASMNPVFNQLYVLL